MPTIDNLFALSQLFHLPIDAVVRGNRKEKISNGKFKIITNR